MRTPRAAAIAGMLFALIYGTALSLMLLLLLSIGYTLWAAIAFPLWMLGFSLYLLWNGLGAEAQTSA